MDLGLDGKVALVAGGSAGIGLAIARDLVREGAAVSIAGRDPGRLAKARDAIRADLGADVGTRALDVRDTEAARAWVDDAASRHGAVHIMVTNAAGPPAGPTGRSARTTTAPPSTSRWSPTSGSRRRRFRTCGRPAGAGS